MSTSIYTIRVQGADGRIVPASFKASSRTAAENMALARGYDVIVAGEDVALPDAALPSPSDESSSAYEHGPEADQAGGDPVTVDEPAHPGAPWAWWAWLLPVFAFVAMLLSMVPALAALPVVVAALLVGSGIVVGIAAIVVARRDPARRGLVHGIIGLIVSVLLLLPLAAGLIRS